MYITPHYVWLPSELPIFHSSVRNAETWLHPRYTDLVCLLDEEISRISLRPERQDKRLETVEGWIVYAHWMPHDTLGRPQMSSRYSEASSWAAIGQAIRWATLLGLDRCACVPLSDDREFAGVEDMRAYRTWIYLVESDHQ